jgi:biotin-dependent carboxylase-like uncharacterized protein
MTTALLITRAGPLATIQDAGRFGMLRHGIGASGPMDQSAFHRAGYRLGAAGTSAIEFTETGLSFLLENETRIAAFEGAHFTLTINGKAQPWPLVHKLEAGDRVDITPGRLGNYGYVRFDAEIDVKPVLGSRSTNLIVGLGGFEGRALKAGDRVPLTPSGVFPAAPACADLTPPDAPIRVIWGIHADLFDSETRQNFVSMPFKISPRLDRMGVRLADFNAVFATSGSFSLVSDAVVAGDIQILGDGTPIVLMRDHQPTGGYPRIATVLSLDFDRFAQMRPGTEVKFQPVTLQRAHMLRSFTSRTL